MFAICLFLLSVGTSWTYLTDFDSSVSPPYNYTILYDDSLLVSAYVVSTANCGCGTVQFMDGYRNKRNLLPVFVHNYVYVCVSIV